MPFPVATDTAAMLQVVEPATENVLAELPHAGVDEANAAVVRAKTAFPKWRAVTPAERAKIMRRIASALGERLEEVARLETRNAGQTCVGLRGAVHNRFRLAD